MNLDTPLATKVLGSLILLIVAALSWFVLLAPTTSEISDTNSSIETAQSNNAVIASRLSALQRQADTLPETRDAADQLAEIFPVTADQPGFFRQVTAAAEDAGIAPDAITDLSPTVPVVPLDPNATATTPAENGDTAAAAPAVNELAVQTVTITVDADYTQAAEFLGNLGGIQRALLVTGVSVVEGEEAPLSVTVTGETYVTPAVAVPDLPAPTRTE